MATSTESFIHLSRPLPHQNVGLQTNLAPLSVNIQPQVRQGNTIMIQEKEIY